MPYEIRESSDGYCVHKQGDSGPALGCHESEAEARQQVKALYSSEATKAIDFSPPETVRSTAAAGLAKRREFGRGGTSIGIARARDLSGGKSISPETAKRMVSFFARHEVDKRGRGFNAGADGYPSNGRIAWELWGGDAGRAWAQKLVRQMEAETTKEHTGVMIALPVPRDALPLIAALQAHLEGMADVEIVPLEEAHVTLLYLGDSSEIEGLKTRIYAGVLNAIEWQDGIPARLTGLARFNGDEDGRNPLVLLVDSPLLPRFREGVLSSILHRGIPDNQRHGFIPHITLGYIPIAAPTPQIEVPQAKIVFDSFVVAWGDEQLIVPLSGEAVKAEGKGYGARAGETIRGNLTRGGDGKFASAGDSAPAAEGEKLPPRRQKLGRSAAARAERKRKVAEAKRQAADAKRQARAAATEQRKRDRAARREAEKKRRAEEAQRKLEANRKEALAKTPLNQEAYDALLAFSKAGDVDEDMARAIAQETGLLTIGSNGELRMNAEGRAFLKALDKGDARAALDAMSRASDRLDREEDKRERDSEKSTLKHGKHNQATHANRYGKGFKATKAQFGRLSKEDRERFKAEARRRRDSDPNSESQRNARWEARPMATGPAAMTRREYGEQQKREVVAMYERQLAQAKRGEIRTGPFNEYPSKAAAVRQLTAGLESVREGSPASFAGDHLSYIGAAIRSGQQIPNDVVRDHFSSRQEMLSVFEVDP